MKWLEEVNVWLASSNYLGFIHFTERNDRVLLLLAVEIDLTPMSSMPHYAARGVFLFSSMNWAVNFRRNTFQAPDSHNEDMGSLCAASSMVIYCVRLNVW
jgi:hypothetical protein